MIEIKNTKKKQATFGAKRSAKKLKQEN